MSGREPQPLPDLIEPPHDSSLWQVYIDALYDVFFHDFVSHRAVIQNKFVGVSRKKASDGKEIRFWHVITKGNDKNRLPENPLFDIERCKRIHWPRYLIENNINDEILWWRQVKSGSKKRGGFYLKLTLSDFSYLVVLFHHKDYFLLVTAYPVDKRHNRMKLSREYLIAQEKGRASQNDALTPPTRGS